MPMVCGILAHAEPVVANRMANRQPCAGRRRQVRLTERPLPVAVGVENLFLRKQLALYAERRVRAHRADDAIRITLVLLARLIDWRAVLTIVKPDTLIRWHRKGFRLLWRWKSKARGRPPLPVDVRCLIAARARANVS